jgi:hypothetical protein
MYSTLPMIKPRATFLTSLFFSYRCDDANVIIVLRDYILIVYLISTKLLHCYHGSKGCIVLYVLVLATIIIFIS